MAGVRERECGERRVLIRFLCRCQVYFADSRHGGNTFGEVCLTSAESGVDGRVRRSQLVAEKEAWVSFFR